MSAGALLESLGSLAPDKKTWLGRRPSHHAPGLLADCSSHPGCALTAVLPSCLGSPADQTRLAGNLLAVWSVVFADSAEHCTGLRRGVGTAVRLR